MRTRTPPQTVEVQSLGGVTDRPNNFGSSPHDAQGWVQIVFQVDKDQTPPSFRQRWFTRGIYGNLSSKTRRTGPGTTEPLRPRCHADRAQVGTHKLAAGNTFLRFECCGQSGPAQRDIFWDSMRLRQGCRFTVVRRMWICGRYRTRIARMDQGQETWTAVDGYLGEHLIGSDLVLAAALVDSAKKKACLRSRFTACQGKFLQLLAQIQGARRILELGTWGGYSTIWLARACPRTAVLITVEVSPEHAEVGVAISRGPTCPKMSSCESVPRSRFCRGCIGATSAVRPIFYRR
jgi:hypothetical protein